MLKTEWAAGTPIADIAVKLGRSAPSVARKVHDLDLPRVRRRRTTMAEIGEMLALELTGMTQADIALAMGRHEITVNKLLVRYRGRIQPRFMEERTSE